LKKNGSAIIKIKVSNNKLKDMDAVSDRPIGVFDSGMGGLTVAHAIKQILPNEKIIYFGDTAHLPYGDKSKEAIIYYSSEITSFLLGNKCKIVLMACNSASAVAFDEVSKQLGQEVIILNVIDPVVKYLEKFYSSGKIGVIGTKATINSGTYESRIKKVCPGLDVVSMAAPLFVPMIEEGFIFDDISNAIIRSYMSKPLLKDINALILGCTHYPIIKNQINKFFDFEVDILDSAKIVALELKALLSEKKLLNQGISADYEFYVSDFTDNFEKIARMFFEGTVNLQKADLWK